MVDIVMLIFLDSWLHGFRFLKLLREMGAMGNFL